MVRRGGREHEAAALRAVTLGRSRPKSSRRTRRPTPPLGPARVLARTRAQFDQAAAHAGVRPRPARLAILEATKWFDAADRNRRHDAILAVLDRWGARSVLEVGSGAGDFYARLRTRLPAVRSYTGCDLSPQMVALARRRYPGADFRPADVLGWRVNQRHAPADAAVAVGVFALLVDDPAAHLALMRRLIRSMFALARIGIVFDFYDFFSEEDARDPRRYFKRELGRTDDTPIFCVQPAEVKRFAARLGPVAFTRIRGVDGRVWRCALRRKPASTASSGW